jgi:aldose 1-epimerase
LETFEIIESTKNSNSEIIIKNIKTNEYISILPENGARLNSAYLKLGDSYFNILKELNGEQLHSRDELFNNAKLFPFANRVKNGLYSFNGKEYQLDINYKEENNACHGILYNKKFKIIEKKINNDFAAVSLFHESTGDYKGYPFSFRLTITYSLSKDGRVKVDTNLLNNGKDNIPVAEGWHPYFVIPDITDNFRLIIPAIKSVIVDETKIPTGKYELIEGERGLEINLFDKEMDNCYLLKNNGPYAKTTLYNDKKQFKLNLWQETGACKYNFLQVFIPPTRDKIALEPMTSNIDAFNNKDHLIIIEPGENWNASFGFYLTN